MMSAEDIEARVKTWLAKRDEAGWFDGYPDRHQLRAQWRSLMRTWRASDWPATGCLFGLVCAAWPEASVCLYSDGSVGIEWPEGECRTVGTAYDNLLAALEAAP